MKPDEMTESLQKIADEQQALILSFVAPDRSVRISPVGAMSASIDIDDLYEIEKVIEDLDDEGRLPKKLHLVIQTPGGLVHVSTKIANYLRRTFKEIHAFVPYEASSGGTVLCLAADRITMGKLANLTPIDPQRPYDDTWVSTASYQRAVNNFEEKFGKKRPAEIPPPYQQMCARLDPVTLTEMNKSWQDTADVAINLLERSYKPTNKEDRAKIMRTALTLTFTPNPHGHMIDSEEAESIGLRIDQSKKSEILLKSYKKWVKSMLGEEKITHVINHFIPQNDTQKSTTSAAEPAEKAQLPKASKPTTDAKVKKEGK
ncbi:MAG TPA: hypothetical protein VF733_01400 [Candidatus Saccharimonadales bacterium]